MPYKLKVDEEKCIGCGACTSEAPDQFELLETDAGYKAKVKKAEIPDEEHEKAKAGQDVCPVDAIILEKA